MSKGVIISLEGLEASGKNSQTRKIVEYLKSQGKQVKLYSFPQYETVIGATIANYLKGQYGDINKVPYELVCIAYAADRASIQKELVDYLNQGCYVIMDRYTYSNLFTAAKLPKEQWPSFVSWIENMEFDNLGIVPPDYNFYLYIDPKISIKRIEQRGKRGYQEGKEDIHENNQTLLINTAECYLNFANSRDNWFVIDQMENDEQLSPNVVFEKIKEKLDLIIKRPIN